MTDEETLERAFLSALRQHFKKPGPWLPIESYSAGQSWTVPNGQVWEFYVQGTDFTLNGITIASGPSGVWMPYAVIPTGLSGEIGTPGMSNTSLAAGALYYFSSPIGYIISGEETLTSTANWTIRKRRRFDLET